MDLSIFQQLGERVDQAYRRVNYDELRLPEIATKALTDTELPDFDFQVVAEFLQQTMVAQDPGEEFSNLPVVVYNQPEFYIQLLVWNASTTTIHQHGFSGAFGVLHGSSIHTRYTFEERRRISSRLLLGRAHFQNIELLKKGDVREIVPGGAGPFHALFHLDAPSVTAVIRTSALPEACPQLSIARPHFAFAENELKTDARTRMLQRCLRAMLEAEDPALSRVVLEQIPTLDFPRIFMLRHAIDRVWPDAEHRERLIARIRERHGDLADCLADVIQMTRNERSLVQARRHTHDPELRFFLALLLNAPARSAIYPMVRQVYSEEAPEARCAAWLARFGNPQAVLDALVRVRTTRGTKQQGETMIERLTAALPRSQDTAVDLVQALLCGVS